MQTKNQIINLQYISDNFGKTAGVFIPIKDWNQLKKKYKELDIQESNFTDIPDWHKTILDERLISMEKKPDSFIDFDTACNDIEQEL